VPLNLISSVSNICCTSWQGVLWTVCIRSMCGQPGGPEARASEAEPCYDVGHLLSGAEHFLYLGYPGQAASVTRKLLRKFFAAEVTFRVCGGYIQVEAQRCLGKAKGGGDEAESVTAKT
jgi:hypothetical protein